MSEPSGIIDPSAGGGAQTFALAPRPASLAGKVLGLLDNTKEQGDVILETIATALRERYGVARVVVRRKDHYSKVAPDSLIAEMAREAQVAIAALGGWGSCTLCSVHDTVEFEKRGVPAAVIITQAFRKAAEFQFCGRGMPGHGLIELPHPISSLSPEEVRRLALSRADEVARQLMDARALNSPAG